MYRERGMSLELCKMKECKKLSEDEGYGVQWTDSELNIELSRNEFQSVELFVDNQTST